MAALSSRDSDELRRLLQRAIIQCSERCLYRAAKWAAELLNALPEQEITSPADTEPDSPISNSDLNHGDPAIGNASINENPREARLEAFELPKYLLAKSYFDCREYDRCAAVFLPTSLPKGELNAFTDPPRSASQHETSSAKPLRSTPESLEESAALSRGFPRLSQKALFIALYAKYMAGEKRRDEDCELIIGPSDTSATVNRELVGVGKALEARLLLQQDRGEAGQGWLEYLYGVVLAKGKNDEAAKEMLIRSVNLYPYNWSAWQELCQLFGSFQEYQQLIQHRVLTQNIMSFIFRVYTCQELFQVSDEIFSSLKEIKRIFPTSSFLRTQKALLHYHSKDYEHAERTFSKILSADPLRLDSLDAYSNILYVMEKQPKLAFLAQLASATDKFRPETCCIIGNYYAMKSEHEKAVIYFRRALTLDRNFLSAWTLMGHEYVEMKNTQAAIECYRHGVDVQRKDYRAWYGLGQTYEMLDMGFYALFYYQRAAALYPLDPKMWSAVGACLAKMDRPQQAVKAFKRALAAGSYYDNSQPGSSFGSVQRANDVFMDPDILFSIAEMYDVMKNETERKAYLELVLVQEDGNDHYNDVGEDLARSITSASASAGTSSRLHGSGVTQTTSRARMWLAKIEIAEADRMTGMAAAASDYVAADQAREKLRRALELANELCQDGHEPEEAKGLVREIRSRLEDDT